jgi:hypothetical protein
MRMVINNDPEAEKVEYDEEALKEKNEWVPKYLYSENDNGLVFSRQQREERNKPPKELDEDDPDYVDPETLPKPFVDDQLFLRICDEKDNFL